MRGLNWEVGSTWYCLPEDFNNIAITDSENPIDAVVGDGTYLSTCRSAIGVALDTEGGAGVALLPAFTCHSVLESFINRGYEIYSYPLNKDLTVNVESFASIVAAISPAVILVHGYFGFDTLTTLRPIIDKLRDAGVTIIEDMTQTMFSDIERIIADYKVGSVRKWLPIPDGAFIADKSVFISERDEEMSAVQMNAIKAKGEYIFEGKGDKSEIMNMFHEAEELLDSRERPFLMSETSIQILDGHNWNEFMRSRKENYDYLVNRLKVHDEVEVIFDERVEGVVPFQLPVYVKGNRREFQQYMVAHNVFPTVIWRCPDILEDHIDDTTRAIYNEILCFYIDQRYDLKDMEKVADIIDNYFKG